MSRGGRVSHRVIWLLDTTQDSSEDGPAVSVLLIRLSSRFSVAILLWRGRRILPGNFAE
jgi:hypothetical protein